PFPVIPTAALIHEAGLKGYTIGGAKVSEKHPNFIINIGNATSADILAVLNFVKSKIKQEYDVNLEVEVEIIA
ncbi:MAG: UDP-N-acetylmuramate dehydrogenase, partial [Patescibacteria group bacterium]